MIAFFQRTVQQICCSCHCLDAAALPLDVEIVTSVAIPADFVIVYLLGASSFTIARSRLGLYGSCIAIVPLHQTVDCTVGFLSFV